jgi:excinuclease UvrABC helicase subunit UvrB
VAAEEQAPYLVEEATPAQIARLKKEMQAAARKLEFERAAALRDRIRGLEQQGLGRG